MEKEKFYFKKSKGQNFLRDKNIIDKIINSANLELTKSAVIEIGPGNGALTDKIIKICKKLIVIEIDSHLIKILQKKYAKNKNIEIIQEDILQVNLKQLIEEKLSEFDFKNIIIISNLPYYITSPVLFKLFSINLYISSFVLMMQKEVGERILANTGTKKYNNLSIISKFYCDIEQIAVVNKNCFFPVPKVDSIVLKFIINKKYNMKNEIEFLYFVRIMFNNKRKMILNNLSSYLNKSKDETKKILSFSNINPSYRPEKLNLENYYNLWFNIKKHHNII